MKSHPKTVLSAGSAVALGYLHAFNNSKANVTIGGSIANGQSSVGVGGAFSWQSPADDS